MDERPDIDDLLRRAQAGEEPALNHLCAYSLKWLSTWGHRRLPDWARERFSTADLTQMTVWSFLKALNRFEPVTTDAEDALKSFLAVIFTNALRDEIRRAKRHGLRADEQDLYDRPGQEPDALEELLVKRALERVSEALKTLSPADQALIAAWTNGASNAEIAVQRGLPTAAAARAAVNRALRRLRTKISRNE